MFSAANFSFVLSIQDSTVELSFILFCFVIIAKWPNRYSIPVALHSDGRGCLREGRLGVPGQVRELRFLPSFPSFPRENWSSGNVWEDAWKSQTSFFQTSAAF